MESAANHLFKVYWGTIAGIRLTFNAYAAQNLSIKNRASPYREARCDFFTKGRIQDNGVQ